MSAFPTVQGRCPACGGTSLFLGAGGYVTCSRIDCPNPSAASDLLEQAADTVPVSRGAFDDLVKVAGHVSYGRSAAFTQPGTPYPDATARRALGALDDAGLLKMDGEPS